MLGNADWLSHGVLVATSAICLTYDQSPVFERPTQSSIIIFFSSGLNVVLLSALNINLFPSSVTNLNTSSLPLQELQLSDGLSNLDNVLPRAWFDVQSLSQRSERFFEISTAVALCLRVEIFRLTLSNRQCMLSGFDGYVPILLAIYDYWYIQRRQQSQDDLSDTTKPSLPQAKPPSGHRNFLISAACIGAANALAALVLSNPRSTYICPLSSHAITVVPLLQVLGLFLDCYILQSVQSILQRPQIGQSFQIKNAPVVIGLTFLLASAILSVGGLIAFVTHSQYWQWVLHVDMSYLRSLSLYVSLVALAIFATIRMIMGHGVVYLSMFITIVLMYLNGLVFGQTNRLILPPTRILPILLFLVFLFLGSASLLNTQIITGAVGASKPPQRRISRASFFTNTSLLLMTMVLGWNLYPTIQVPDLRWNKSYPFGIYDFHPIDELMNRAREKSQAWATHANSSVTLIEVVEEYRRRYQRHPPPGFDAWYRYATERSTVIIDDYDNISEDLQPFWGLTPAEIRLRTGQVISDTWNDIAEVRIRNGVAGHGPNFKPTHQWMVDGVLEMMKDFSQWLPDMDLAFNLNDEPRVAPPFKDMQNLQQIADASARLDKEVSNQWSSDRKESWEGSEEENPSRPFAENPFMNSFSANAAACSSSSPAQKYHTWDPSILCTSCAAPHSYSVFLSNWTLSASPCHQPDLRNLHGFYLSPASLKPSSQLLPIFSQGKVAGYSDILYPSPWNYMDKVKYDPSDTQPDPPFTSKTDSLFWRGATSEGISRYGTWRGMNRQRLVHLASNLTHTSRSPTLPLFLPHPDLPGRYSHQILPSNPIKALNLTLDIAIVNDIQRAWDNDGAAQDAEFGLVGPSDFQDHWRHRFLFDMDGAGFSGRFPAFLQSRSLPFRAGIFRTWYDSRLIAWRHFVPIDVRLHGLLSTLAYFMGTADTIESKVGGRKLGMRGNTEAGEEIADAGREWAGRVLRKEDMEIYMFRLLLEWGRLTDDRREVIGFVI